MHATTHMAGNDELPSTYGGELCAETGKLGYRNVRAARRALHSCQRSRQAGSRARHESSFYRCEFCSRFHLTSAPEDGHKRFT